MIIYLIKEIRILKGMKLKELSDITGLSISYLSEIENNKNCNPSLLTVMKIAKALDKKLDDLCFIDDELDSLKGAINIYIEVYGIQDIKTIELSNKINELLNKYGSF
ncbi:MAG: helix-turn-helix transcriptional regulator [Clostridia bacterium]|nr:helix-turn-helix transcriptional regulator [Clostridia bacterium]